MSTPTDIPVWVGPALTAIGLVVSVGVVVFQLGKQHKSSLKLQRSNAREALKLKVYELLSEKALVFSEADLAAWSYADSIVRELYAAAWAAGVGLSRDTTDLRSEELSRLHFAASAALTDLIVAIESWEIAFPASELFRVALMSANRDVDESFTPVFEGALRLLPVEFKDGKVLSQPRPTAEKLDEFRQMVKAYSETRTTLRTYTHDLVVEAQNLLLSKLFKRRVKIRKPFDPAYKVITARDTDNLMRYFETETAAGRSWSAATQRARERAQASDREEEE